MNELDKVYIVTAGSYSDYGIVAVFDSEETAQTFVAIRNGPKIDGFDAYRVEGYPIERELPAKMHSGETRAVPIYIRKATAWDNKEQQLVEDEPSGVTVFVDPGTVPPELEVKVDRRKNAFGDNLIHLTVKGPDYKQVRKVYGERLAQERAQLLGL